MKEIKTKALREISGGSYLVKTDSGQLVRKCKTIELLSNFEPTEVLSGGNTIITATSAC